MTLTPQPTPRELPAVHKTASAQTDEQVLRSAASAKCFGLGVNGAGKSATFKVNGPTSDGMEHWN